LKSLKAQAGGVYRQRGKGRATKTSADWRAAADTSRSACPIGVGSAAEGRAVRTISLVVKVVNERIVFANVRAVSLVLECVVEETDSATRHEFGSGLICETRAWSEVGLLGLHEGISVLIRLAECNTVLGQQVEESLPIQGGIIRGRRQLPIVFA
jgi:hypothetical protein